ncbi:anthranilate phosphoribosyltransferase [Ekhidna lutea]|uniref:Anthranilate phosphoribosyltransferase n=1 Tax=Ekhidna lutea TaxID=447679 RepID=A0A239M307_EKHLU|nr:anthranilate phosphoribosyltransferase [Ekhidna lutea]SNT36503.1 anthranilate phosphoribosyltransferase [Ekhidna lutea]
MKEILNRLINNQILSRDEAKEVLTGLATGQYNNSQIASFLTVYLMRPIRVEELEGFRDAMLDLCNPVDLEGYNAIDVCGTGGDGKNTFNISTISSFIVAGAGVNVAKHGNYGVSSVSGSSNVLEHLGAKFSGDSDQMKKSMDASGICFMHAPLFHPAMKNVGPIRKELGVKTFFNMLGPMVNPSFPPNQLVGVFSLELARLYGYLYQNTDKNFSIVHSLDGYDEISLTSEFKLISNGTEKLVAPDDMGFDTLHQDQLHGGETVEEAANIFNKILSGEGTIAQNHAVLANAGLAISTVKQSTFEEGVNEARISLESGKALKSFKNFLSINS